METLYLKRNQHCSTKKTPFSLGTIDGKLHLIFICRRVMVPILLIVLVISSYLWLLSHTCLLQISLLNYTSVSGNSYCFVDRFFSNALLRKNATKLLVSPQLVCFSNYYSSILLIMEGLICSIKPRLCWTSQSQITWLILSAGNIPR